MLAEGKVIKNLVSGSIKTYDLHLPQTYAEIARYVKSFTFKDYTFNFNYPKRDELIEGTKFKLEDIEKNGKYVLCGVTKNKEPIVMDKNNVLYIYKNNKYQELGDILDLVNIDKSKLKIEYSFIKMFKELIPVGFVLAYYLGLENLLKALKVDYEKLEGKKNVKEPNSIVVKFKFNTLVIRPKTERDWMILEGLKHYEKKWKNIDIDLLNNRDSFKALLSDLGLKLHVVTQLDVVETLFVDPVTKTILEDMGEPTTFVGLLIRASEMLVDDYYIHPNDMKGYIIKGYERIPQMIYRNIIDSIIKKKNEEYFGRSRLSVDPYEVWRIINADSTTILVNDLNPIMWLKQKDDTTYLGWLGRQKESMSKQTRELHPNDLGIMSESSKDSGDVGITAYLTASPVFKNIRGIKDMSKKVQDMKWSNLTTTTVMLSPFVLKDDPKRVVYANIMNSHIIPVANPKLFPVRTGYETVIPYRAGKKFCGFAKDDGVVESVSKHKAIVKYKNGKKETFEFKNWTSKEESRTTYLHKMVANVEKGQKVKKGDIIYYDQGFFEPDPFDKTKVVYRPGTIVKVAFNEDMNTHEDASLISEKLSKNVAVEFVKVRDMLFDADTAVKEFKKIGDHVEPNDLLMIITSKLIGDEKLDKKTIDLLQAFVKSSPKAKYKGEIIKIEVYYNCNKSDMSAGMKKLVEYAEEHMVDPETGKKYPGKVDESYSVDGKSLIEGKVHVKFYIKEFEHMKTGDKGIVGLQLKTTVTNIANYPIVNENGEEIDIIFSLRGVYARIVNSAFLMGTTATLLDLVGRKAVKMYFGK